MSEVSELKKLVKALQQASSEKETIEVLQVLKKEAKITEAILRESKAGLAVGKLRSHATKDISELAKEVVRQWKTEVDKEKKASGAVKSPTIPSTKPAAPSRRSSVATPTTPTPSTPGSTANGSSTRTTKSDGINTEVTRDKTRDKCIELMYDALAYDCGAPSDLIFQRAKAVEDAVFAVFNGTSGEYKTKIRSLVVNLKDKKNPGLRESVVSGDITATKLAKMTSQEMASDDRKNADKKIMEENMFKSLGAEEQQAETDAFQCGRCKQRKCRYRQAQTRSADEPMTTFVTCTVCNNRWKFS